MTCYGQCQVHLLLLLLILVKFLPNFIHRYPLISRTVFHRLVSSSLHLSFLHYLSTYIWFQAPQGRFISRYGPLHSCYNMKQYGIWKVELFFIFLLFILVYSISVGPIFPPLLSSAQPTSYSHSHSPQGCLSPWVIHICSLTNPFPFFPPFPLLPPLWQLSVYSMFPCPWFCFPC